MDRRDPRQEQQNDRILTEGGKSSKTPELQRGVTPVEYPNFQMSVYSLAATSPAECSRSPGLHKISVGVASSRLPGLREPEGRRQETGCVASPRIQSKNGLRWYTSATISPHSHRTSRTKIVPSRALRRRYPLASNRIGNSGERAGFVQSTGRRPLLPQTDSRPRSGRQANRLRKRTGSLLPTWLTAATAAYLSRLRRI